MAVEYNKPFLDIAYGFPVIVVRRVGLPKKNYLREDLGKIILEVTSFMTHTKVAFLSGNPLMGYSNVPL